jgi:hypothetical protein
MTPRSKIVRFDWRTALPSAVLVTMRLARSDRNRQSSFRAGLVVTRTPPLAAAVEAQDLRSPALPPGLAASERSAGNLR